MSAAAIKVIEREVALTEKLYRKARANYEAEPTEANHQRYRMDAAEHRATLDASIAILTEHAK
jgi:hypothetical protein